MPRPADPVKREAILRAARAIFVERGYESARMAEIAERAGVATGTIYLYFQGKEELVIALVEAFLTRIAERVAPLFELPDISEAIERAVRTTIELSESEADLLRLARLQVGLGRRDRQHRVPARDRLTDGLATMLRVRMDRGEVRPYDPEALAELITALVEWVDEVCLISGARDLRRYEATLVTLLRHALVPDASGDRKESHQ
ncbi:MAG TPA: helix-turn-helix domain-containing protein [Ktedonobacterales bacterium]